MNKAELIAALAEKTGRTKADSGEFIDALGAIITEALGSHDEVSLPSVGKFAAAHRAARTVRNPRTGEKNEAPAHYAPVFKPASALREAVRNGKG
ncbi:HU family DNA-binding protein [Paralimibaculum aggregatum]|uniref:HU family DNA-binding protein n=1 Tax=Paralimibaculum aggregatum TaxID=3036245 RepID=A0ABQ6LJY1_9RHOB|nr:HU family DNA-binding protein [Limibaculum sp. NKW23]GMG83568.1 HU family DNA-binding protein [Limibaculum sp. NKW23]